MSSITPLRMYAHLTPYESFLLRKKKLKSFIRPFHTQGFSINKTAIVSDGTRACVLLDTPTDIQYLYFSTPLFKRILLTEDFYVNAHGEFHSFVMDSELSKEKIPTTYKKCKNNCVGKYSTIVSNIYIRLFKELTTEELSNSGRFEIPNTFKKDRSIGKNTIVTICNIGNIKQEVC